MRSRAAAIDLQTGCGNAAGESRTGMKIQCVLRFDDRTGLDQEGQVRYYEEHVDFGSGMAGRCAG